MQAGALGVPAAAVDDFGGFEGQYESIEKVAAHHGNYWEVLLYGHLLKDRSTIYDLISVREGAISSTLLLRRLRSGSRKNATGTAFREVGRVIRTVQLLRYLSDRRAGEDREVQRSAHERGDLP